MNLHTPTKIAAISLMLIAAFVAGQHSPGRSPHKAVKNGNTRSSVRSTLSIT
jgi:hypothetical protein